MISAFHSLMLCLDGYDVYDGTNEAIRDAFCKFVYQRHFKSANGRGYVVMQPMQDEIKEFHPTPLSSLNNLSLSIRRPNGTLVNDSRDDYRVTGGGPMARPVLQHRPPPPLCDGRDALPDN